VTSVAVGLTVLAGLAGAVQVAVMGKFGARIGIGLLAPGAGLTLAR
jgi:hypothetical protein